MNRRQLLVYVDRVKKYYRDNKSYYHTIDHIVDLFYQFVLFEEEFDKEFQNLEPWQYDKNELCWAIAYHDAFYVPGFKHNEYISSEIATKDLFSEVRNLDLHQVAGLIMSTSIGYNHDNDCPLAKILHDLDWSGFSDYAVMTFNEQKIINESVEISGFNRDEVIKRQVEFYKKFSQSDIYLTKAFSMLNHQVRNNMLIRIKEISNNA